MEIGHLVVDRSRGDEASDRRRAPRFPADAAIGCAVREPRTGCWLPAAVVDLSESGISVLTDEQFELGQLLTIELRHDGNGLAREYMVEVCHDDICFPNDDWLHGCRFAHPLSPDELRLWL